MSLILVFHNDGTGFSPFGNYNVTVRINEKVIDTRRIEGHRRLDGWEKLVRKAFPCPSCSSKKTVDIKYI